MATIYALFTAHGKLLVRFPIPTRIAKLLEGVDIFFGWLRPHVEVHSRATTYKHI